MQYAQIIKNMLTKFGGGYNYSSNNNCCLLISKENMIMQEKCYWAMHKECATCEYWNGPRRIVSDNRVVYVPTDYQSAMGTCCGDNRTYRGKQTHASLSGGVSVTCWTCMRGLKI